MQDYLNHIFDEVDPNIHLDEEQKQVVVEDGDMLVIAGAGSGKTTTMVAKVKYLIEVKKVNPEDILMISYTNKATEELIDRIKKDFHLPIDILTFHKLGLKMIKKYKNISISTDNYLFLEKVIKQMRKTNKWRFQFYARKYCKRKDISKLVLLSENFIKNYKMKGKPNIDDMMLSKFWKFFFKTLIEEYEEYMKKQDKIDFEDMVLEATTLIKEGKVEFSYRYVIVDEYQDISMDRFLLLQALKEKFFYHLIVVGDDWQSIFGFSGSEIKLFTSFSHYFPNSNMLKITSTYRNSQELIDIAGKFVMKNQLQIKKQLRSSKHLDYPIIFVPYRRKNNKKLFEILEYISTLRDFSTVFLLGRYHKDFNISDYSFLSQKENKIFCPQFPNLNIEFLTVHSSKGLGADEVILLNVNSGTYGFPTNKKTDSILKTVESIDVSYPYAEERRLFYVALTRTKNHVFILYSKNSGSPFVKELKNDYKDKLLFI